MRWPGHSCPEPGHPQPFALLQDFEANAELQSKVMGFLEEVMHDPELLTQERKAAANILRCRVPTWDIHTGLDTGCNVVSTHGA